MHFGTIKLCDIANGHGVRTTLFVSGCTHHCKGCFQPETWNFTYGNPFDETTKSLILGSLKPDYVTGLTVLGGEPFEPENQKVLSEFLKQVKEKYPTKDIWCYTGDLYQDLINPDSPRHTDYTDTMLEQIDILVDGPFIEAEKDITLRFRGSKNQRIIDLNKTRANKELTTWHDDEIFDSRGQWI